MGKALELWLPADPQSVPSARHEVREFLNLHRVSEPVVADLELATSEAVANAVLHGQACGDRGVSLQVSVNSEVTIEVCDCGQFLERPPSGIGGMGLKIIRKLSDEMDVEKSRGQTLLRLRRRLMTTG
jgi:anti-sigma regulatory factor (Ser/Thr protein kinase)